MKKYSIIVLFLLTINSIYSQQTPVFSEYHYNPFLINSAYAGLISKEITVTHNGTFTGFDGAPTTSSLSYTSDIPYSSLGYGFGATNDQIGVTKNTSIYGAMSYKIEFDHVETRADWEIYDMNVLSFSLNAGIQLYRDDLLSLELEDDPNFNENVNLTIPTIGAAIIYNRANFFAGISSPNLIGTSLANNSLVKLETQLYGYSGFRFYTSKFERLLLKPNVLFKYQKGTPLQVDFNISGKYQNLFELGLGYRTTTSFSSYLLFKISNKFNAMANYTWSTNNNPIGARFGIGLKYLVKE